MTPQCLNVLAPIAPGRETALREILRTIGDDVTGRHRSGTDTRPHIAFVRSRTIHFARFAVLNDPDRGPGRTRLLFASVFDGSLEAHLGELVTITSDMAAIWGACEGYTGVAGFPAFMRAHAHESAAYYIAFREESVASIGAVIDARRARHYLQDGGDGRIPAVGSVPAHDSHAVIGRLAAGFRRFARAAPLVLDVVRAIARCGLGNVFFGTRRITASLDRYLAVRIFNRLTLNSIPPRRSPFSSVSLDHCAAVTPLAPHDEIPAAATAVAPAFREDAVVQNQLTVVTVVDPRSVDRVRAVMAAIDSYAKRLSPAGSLIGISTIHFVRWVLIDGGRRLMLVSDYDGSWESYIDEFAEMILTGLDAIWETSYGMPADGARDLSGFKRFLRSHQVPSDVFFAAYPDETVLNISADRAAAGALSLEPAAAR